MTEHPSSDIKPSKDYNLLVILGPTASGKTHLGVALAQRLGGEIISADSRQVFRGMDIGTGKDLGEYGAVPYHLIDIMDPGELFSVYAFQQHFYAAFEDICARGCLPLLVGGSGLYMDAILRSYQLAPVTEKPDLREALSHWKWADLEARLRRARPNLHNTTDLDTRERLVRAIEIAEGSQHQQQTVHYPLLKPLVLGLRWQRPVLRQRITTRLQERLEAGLLVEVETLLLNGLSHERLAAYGLEYRFACRYLRGELTWDDFFRDLNQAIHRFAKRQETWFRRMERHGIVIHWLEGASNPLEAAESIAC